MFAKLRPGHRRSGSTPTSPSPNQIPAGFLPLPPNSSHGPTSPSSIEDFLYGHKSPDSATSAAPPLSANPNSNASAESPISPLPPSLPPIPRIASVFGKPNEQERPQGLGLHAPELQRVRTSESMDSRSSGSPILGEQAFNFGRYDQTAGQDRTTMVEQAQRRPGTGGEGTTYRPQTLVSPQSFRKDGISESEFRSILQGKHLPPLPNGATAQPRKTHEVMSPPPMLQTDESQQVYMRPPTMALGNQSRQSLASVNTRTSDRTGKTKLHLLNPMSLLLRRRNGQMLDHLAEESLVTHRNTSIISPNLPDNFDPSIRGKVVHDFSAPRQRRNFSNQSMTELSERERRESVSKEGRDTKSRNLSEDMRHERTHTPVFKEHFEDDVDQQRTDSAIRAENLANKDFVARNSFHPPEPLEAPSSLPPFARVGQKTVYKPQDQTILSSSPPPPVPAKDTEQAPARPPLPLSPLMEDPSTPDTDVTPKRTSNAGTIRQSLKQSKRSPPSARSSRMSRMSLDTEFQPGIGLPAHMFSRSSRFSFQYAGTDSVAQERMLEEKHREKQAKALAERGSDPEPQHAYDEEDEFNYDDMDSYAGMEDDVPMAGEDWDYGGGLGIGNMTLDDMSGGGLGNMTLDDMNGGGLGNMTLDDMNGGGGLGNMTLDDMDGGGLGDMTLDDLGAGGLGHMSLDDMPTNMSAGLGHMTLEGLSAGAAGSEPKAPSYNPLRDNPVPATADAEATKAVQDADRASSIAGQGQPSSSSAQIPSLLPDLASTSGQRKPSNVDSFIEQDDFYFDTGEFDDELLAAENGAEAFDESVFDDPNHPLYERKQPTQVPPIPRMSSKRTHNTIKGRNARPRPPSDPLPEHPDPSAPMDIVDAYHSALAMAATKAAAAGRFDRANSIDSNDSSSPTQYHGGPVRGDGVYKLPHILAQPELTPDHPRLSQDSSTLSPPTARASGGVDQLNSLTKSVDFMLPGAGAYDDAYTSDFDYSDYDSAFEDDAMVAAANAEALENDDEGLYGTEFGFYARPGATETDENGSMYGGYFGPKNWGEIKRQRSTREPNLTPITERSEYSTRNSFIGMGFAEHERGQPSPGLAALARMSPSWDGDMSMEALRKLRRGAWGGSQSSNVDKNSPRASSSPMNSSPVMPKGDQQRLHPLWSSPMSRQMITGEDIPEADADDEYDEDMLEEANYGDEDEDDQWTGEEYEGEEYEESVSPEEESPLSESPTIRAQPPQQAHSNSSVSPMRLGPPFAFPQTDANHRQPQPAPPSVSSPTNSTSTTSMTMMTAMTTPLIGAQTLSQRSSLAVASSPISPVMKPSHSRSGSDSVAYVRERDEEKGEFRWVLERRRTGEDGGEFLVDRTPVEGGRI